MPTTFKVGDTAECRINREPARVTWRDKDTLVIEPDDAQRIVFARRSWNGDSIDFVCTHADPNWWACLRRDYPELAEILERGIPAASG
jgi:hypothetical protein